MAKKYLLKVLERDNKSPYRSYLWTVPDDKGNPGRYEEVHGDLLMCLNGLHGWNDANAYSNVMGPQIGHRLYVMEYDTDDDHIVGLDKTCVSKARLVRYLGQVETTYVNAIGVYWLRKPDGKRMMIDKLNTTTGDYDTTKRMDSYIKKALNP